VDILEQLEQKILNTVSALDDARKECINLRDECSNLREENNKATAEIEALKQQIAEANQRLEHRDTAIGALQHQYESAKKESIRLAHEKNDWEVKVTALMETIEQSVTA
jgi:chromosome segregation ATPase